MTLDEMKDRLRAEGFGSVGGGPLIYESGPRLLALYDLRVEQVSGIWRVCVTERGEVVETRLATVDEAAACQAWYDMVSDTMVLLSDCNDAARADRAQRALQMAGIETLRNDVPPQLARDGRRYRIFVRGKDLLRAKQLA